MRDGVIYVAVGGDYVDLAVQSAESVKRWNPGLAVDLVTDVAQRPEVFDAVHVAPSSHPRVYLECLGAARFERVLYLDADTLALAPFGDLFDIADRFPLALAHDVRRRSALVKEGGGPYAFPQMNSGVMLYRQGARMQAFFDAWKARYDALGLLRDQVSLKQLLWEGELPFYVLPPEFNLRRTTLLDAWEPLDADPVILHSHRLLQHLRGQGAQVTTLDEIRVLERAALAEEWANELDLPEFRPLGFRDG
ncbi:hypothetical protein [Mesobacterium pallidum]|uniref:hypothetical protein n=1 Tax=Mesobacterium pallidum TaxID=2872037 RepID=UPI001EE39D27|nr:hypothetical protein [Mesobacterium pallidum]